MTAERRRLEAILRTCDAALVETPQDARLYKDRGNALQALERYEAAIESYDRAIALKPDYADAHYNRGVVLLTLERHDAALKSFDSALALNPRDAEAHNNRGISLAALERYEAAIESLQRALALQPQYVDACYNTGNVLKALHHPEQALAFYDRALALQTPFAEAWNNRGKALHDLKRFEDALASYDRALDVKSDYAEALSNRGDALQELGRYEEALSSLDRALDIDPALAEAWNVRGNTLQELRRYEEALASHERALSIKHDYAEALSSRGNALKELNRYEDALASQDRALAVRPDYPEALGNRALALQNLRRFDEALAGFERLLAIQPDSAEAHWNESLCRLLMGDFARGWEQYEWRWKCGRLRIQAARRGFSEPLWLGKQDLAGKSILLHCEQGLGDTLQFCRYVGAVAQRGASVVLEVQPPLKRLLSGLAGVSKVLSEGEPLPRFDCHCPLLSLPLAFDTRLETIPAPIPYLSADAVLVAQWARKLGPKRAARVGIVWSGGLSHKNDRNRSIALSTMLPLTEAGVELVSLQREVRAEDERMLAANGRLLHFGLELEDFADTAALVSLMDLVISVDTSVAHLAGALGKPVWILLPFASDWRWLVDRQDSPWYPSARLFRQPRPGTWGPVMEQVKQSLTTRVRSS